MSVDHYTYRVTWSQEDGEYLGLCIELPSLSWLAATPLKALSGIRQVASEAVADMQSNGEPVPMPLAEKHYSAGPPLTGHAGRGSGREFEPSGKRKAGWFITQHARGTCIYQLEVKRWLVHHRFPAEGGWEVNVDVDAMERGDKGQQPSAPSRTIGIDTFFSGMN